MALLWHNDAEKTKKGACHMNYYSPSVKQCLKRKGKPWRATVYYKDPETQKAKQKTKMLPDAKGKREAERMAREWMEELNKIVINMPQTEQNKTVEEIVKKYEDYRLETGKIEKSTYKSFINLNSLTYIF